MRLLPLLLLALSCVVLVPYQTFVPNGTWLQPLSILTPRFVKFGAQIDF